MIKAIFFDFDGTVSDAKEIAYLSMVRTLEEYGFDFSERKLRKLMGSKVHVILKELGLNVDELEPLRKEFYKHFARAIVDDGVKSCVSLKPLWELKKDYPLIIISHCETSFLKTSIKELGIGGLFKKVYGAEKFGDKDEILRDLFKKMKIDASEAIYVGDRFSDVVYAKKAGCVSVAINNRCSWSTLKEVKKEKPDFIIKDFRGLRKILKLKAGD